VELPSSARDATHAAELLASAISAIQAVDGHDPARARLELRRVLRQPLFNGLPFLQNLVQQRQHTVQELALQLYSIEVNQATFGCTALHLAASRSDLQSMQLLGAAGANFNAQDDCGLSLLLLGLASRRLTAPSADYLAAHTDMSKT
jgi:Ankyrin repeat